MWCCSCGNGSRYLASLAVMPLCDLHDGSAHCVRLCIRTSSHACMRAGLLAPHQAPLNSAAATFEPSPAVCLRICQQQQHLPCCCHSPFRFACMLHLTSCYGSLSMWHAHSTSLHGCGATAQWLVRLFAAAMQATAPTRCYYQNAAVALAQCTAPPTTIASHVCTWRGQGR